MDGTYERHGEFRGAGWSQGARGGTRCRTTGLAPLVRAAPVIVTTPVIRTAPAS